MPTVWPAAVSIPPHATAKRHGSAPQTFLNTVLWPEFQEINAALHDYLAQVTDKVIREAVYKHTGDAEEVAEPEKLAR